MKAHLEPIAIDETSSLNARYISEKYFKHPLHYHPEFELTYIVSSSGTRLVGDHVGSFTEGDLCLIGENLPHLYTNTVKPTTGAEAEVLQFNRNFSNDFIDATPEMHPFSQLLDEAGLGIIFDSDTANAAGQLMSKIRSSQGFSRFFTFMELVKCLISAKETHSLVSPGYTGASAEQDSERMQVACSYIIEHFSEDIDHTKLAAEVHLAPASFSRLFKRVTRKTCTAFINEVRIGHACRLLMETNAPITEIAFSCGFRNLSNFNRHFLKRYNCSPRQYRQQKTK